MYQTTTDYLIGSSMSYENQFRNVSQLAHWESNQDFLTKRPRWTTEVIEDSRNIKNTG